MPNNPDPISVICSKHGLTEKQTQFVANFARHGRNATRAYKMAYAVRDNAKPNAIAVEAHRLLHNKKVQAVLEEIETTVNPAIVAHAVHLSALNRAWIMKRLAELVERGMHGSPVLDADGSPVLVVTAEGELMASYGSDLTVALKALEVLGRTLGMFDRKVIEQENVSPEIKERREAARRRLFRLLKENERGHFPEDEQSKDTRGDSATTATNEHRTTVQDETGREPPENWEG